MDAHLAHAANASGTHDRAGRNGRGRWRLGVAVFVASVVTTLMFWTVVPSSLRINESSDYRDYYEPVARQIVGGHGLVSTDGRPALRTPPGHPLFLALGFAVSRWTGIPEAVVLPASCVLSMGIASFLLFAIARSIWGSGPGLLTAGAWITYPLGLWLTKQPNSELPFLVVFYLAVFLFVRLVTRSKQSGALAFAVGVLAGASMLIRPIAVGLGLVMASISIAGCMKRGAGLRHGLAMACLILCGNLLAVAPWEAWMYSRTGRLLLLQVTGPRRSGLILQTGEKKVPGNVASLAGKLEERLSSEGQLGGARLLVEELRTRPWEVVVLVALKFVRPFYGTDSGRFEKPILFIQLAYLAAIGWSSVVALRRNRSFTLTILVLGLYFWAITVAAFTLVRYMVPAFGLLFALLPAVLRRGAVGNSEAERAGRSDAH